MLGRSLEHVGQEPHTPNRPQKPNDPAPGEKRNIAQGEVVKRGDGPRDIVGRSFGLLVTNVQIWLLSVSRLGFFQIR